MEIVHIILGKANPKRMNGVNKVVNDLANKLNQIVETEVWGFSRSTASQENDQNYKVKLFKTYTNPFVLDESFEQEVEKNNSRAVVYHLHGGYQPLFYSISRVLRRWKKPFVLTPHGAYNLVVRKNNPIKKGVYLNLFEKKVIKNAKTIHCLGRSEVEGLENIYPDKKHELLPYGFRDNIGEVPWNNKEFVVGFCGRLDIKTKGLDILFRAFHRIHEEYRSIKLWIIGDGPQRKELEDISKELGLLDQVVFWGKKFGEEKYDLLRKMNVFVHPSRNEGLPTAVMEASSLGIPVIVSKHTNLDQAIEKYKSGLVTQEETPEELGSKIVSLYTSPKNVIQNYSEMAHKMIRTEFNWQQLLPGYIKMYRNAIKSA